MSRVRYPVPYGYQIPRDSFEAPPMPSVSDRGRRRDAYRRMLREQFDGILATAIEMWGVAYVRERVAVALANATASSR